MKVSYDKLWKILIDKKMKKCKCFCEKNVKKLIFLRILEEFVDKFLEMHGKNKV